MLAKKYRFHGHGGVRRTYRHGRPARTGFFSVHVLSGERVKSTKVAVVVSRKVHRSAVKRNRIRRRIYELIRNQMAEIKHPSEIVITVYKPEAAEMPASELAEAVTQLLKKARLI